MSEIKVFINNKAECLDENSTVRSLLQAKKMRKAAVWINGRQLLKSEYDTHIIKDGDNIKLLRIMAGG